MKLIPLVFSLLAFSAHAAPLSWFSCGNGFQFAATSNADLFRLDFKNQWTRGSMLDPAMLLKDDARWAGSSEWSVMFGGSLFSMSNYGDDQSFIFRMGIGLTSQLSHTGMNASYVYLPTTLPNESTAFSLSGSGERFDAEVNLTYCTTYHYDGLLLTNGGGIGNGFVEWSRAAPTLPSAIASVPESSSTAALLLIAFPLVHALMGCFRLGLSADTRKGPRQVLPQ